VSLAAEIPSPLPRVLPAAPAGRLAPMSDHPAPVRAWWKPLAFLGVWTLVGLAFAGQHYLKQARLGVPVNWSVAIGGALADWYVFALLSLPVAWLARRFPLGGQQWRLRVALHLVASAVFSLLWMLLRALLEGVLPGHGPALPFREILRYVLVATFFFNVLVYWVVVVGAHALDYSRSLRERELRVLDLEKRLTSARLHALQMQLNPHFLFNSLNGIGSLMYRDVDAADTMLVKLSELLRHALDRSDEHRVPLRDELAFLDRYLALEQMRFAERLTVRREIAPETLEALVPNLILQPLVENAIKHGIEPQTRPGVITLRATVTNGQLRLEVEDNGRGLPADGRIEGGIGTANTRARLTQLYGRGGRIGFAPGAEGGVRVTLELPLDTSPNR